MSLIFDRSHCESEFEYYIIKKLEQNGWCVGHTSGYDVDTALYPEDVEQWIKTTQPTEWEKLVTLNQSKTLDKVLDRLAGELRSRDAIDVFKKGFSIAGCRPISMTESAPEDARNQAVIERYDANILRVVPQLRYAGDNRAIDLVFFINGIPMATVELKTEFNQAVENAKEQYRTDRQPKEKNKTHWLLMPRHGAIVHFAMSESLIYMTTELKGKATSFLPFNKGNHGHAGNAPADRAKGEEYPVAYFWDYVCQRDNWLRIFHEFIYIEKKEVVDLQGKWHRQERLIFPRYHQFDAVNNMIADIKANGVGKNYLCEHSAGSGKTATIAWLCHALTKLRYEDGSPFYHSAIVVTDRTVLDNQLQEAIQQIDHQKGLIAPINRNQKENSGQSKSKQLAEALLSGKPVIIVTIDTFPYVLEAILTERSLSNNRFAIIIDEAHNSQTGSKAAKLQATLMLDSAANMKNMTVEDLLSQLQNARTKSANISHFAFTATPKHSTLMLFGRTANGQPASDENLPESFHKYTMRQAIEEGFILDVLKAYTPYKTAYNLSEEAIGDEKVDTKAAKRTIARWKSLHATNVTQKVIFILEHFHKNVANLLGGRAKAMIVTSSRPAAMRYKLALDRYLQEHSEYQDYRAIVAFSGSLKGSDIRHDSDETLDGEFSGVFDIAEGSEFTEASANIGLPTTDLKQAFDRPEYRLMVVANKFQTGFDQPKLCAMYLDKEINNEVEVVQTLSRLNRTTSGKDTTFVIDFVNDNPEWILSCFKKYDSGAEITEMQDPNIVFTAKQNLDDAHLYHQDDIEKFKNARFKTAKSYLGNDAKNTTHADLYDALDPIVRNYNSQLKDARQGVTDAINFVKSAEAKGDEDGVQKAEFKRKEYDQKLQNLQRFKSDLGKFERYYAYILQVINLGDPDLENFADFCKLLAKRLDGVSVEEIDISGLILRGYDIVKRATADDGNENKDNDLVLQPILGTKNGELSPRQLEQLKVIIKMISDAFGDTSTPDEQKIYIKHLVDIIKKDENVMMQIRLNEESIAMQGNLPSAVVNAVIQAMESHSALSALLLQPNSKSLEIVKSVIYKILKSGERFDI